MEALVETQFASVPPFRPEPESAHVKVALDLLQKAERPIIVAGGGARASGAGRELLRSLKRCRYRFDVAERQGHHPRHAFIVGWCRGKLFA